MGANLAFWSLVALLIRVLAIAVLVYVMTIQIGQFRYKSSLQPLKWLLLSTLITLIALNLPIAYLHWLRIFNLNASASVTSFATVANAAGTLLVALLLLFVYRYRGVE